MIGIRMKAGLFSLAVLIGSVSANAHVRVFPAQGKAGDKTAYTMSVPTEGKVATSRVELVLPKGSSLVSVDEEGKPFEVKHPADGTTIIIWSTEIPPGWARAFKFVVVNPAGVSEIAWKAHQYYTDGTQTNWVEPESGKFPASITKIAP